MKLGIGLLPLSCCHPCSLLPLSWASRQNSLPRALRPLLTTGVLSQDLGPPGLCGHCGLTSFQPDHRLSPELIPHARAEGGSFPDQGSQGDVGLGMPIFLWPQAGTLGQLLPSPQPRSEILASVASAAIY